MPAAVEPPRIIGAIVEDRTFDVECTAAHAAGATGTRPIQEGDTFDLPPHCCECERPLVGATPTPRGLRRNLPQWLAFEMRAGVEVGAQMQYAAVLADGLEVKLAEHFFNYCDTMWPKSPPGQPIEFGGTADEAHDLGWSYNHYALEQARARRCDLTAYVMPDGAVAYVTPEEAPPGWVAHCPVNLVVHSHLKFTPLKERIADHFARTMRRSIPVQALPQAWCLDRTRSDIHIIPRPDALEPVDVEGTNVTLIGKALRSPTILAKRGAALLDGASSPRASTTGVALDLDAHRRARRPVEHTVESGGWSL